MKSKSGGKVADKMVNRDRCLEILEGMFTSRFIDQKMGKLVRQNKGGTFQLSAEGHEMIGVLCGAGLQTGKDYGFPYYRDQPFAVGLGCPSFDIFAAFMARDAPNHSRGRMMPGHFCDKERRIPPQSSVVGSQFLQATGVAHSIKTAGLDEIVYVSGGEGSTSQGDFHEALNFSCIHDLPIVFVIQDNGYAISVPVEEQTAGGNLLSILEGYEGLSVFDVDGCDFEACSETVEKAYGIARSGKGPCAILARVPRLGSHSNSDNCKKYLTDEDLEEAQSLDPIPRYSQWLVQKGLMTEADIEKLRQQCFQKVEEAAKEADTLPYPDAATAADYVFALQEQIEEQNLSGEGEKVVIVDAVNQALKEEMARDQGVLVFGQDVARGKGGVFGASRDLTDLYGADRCFNTPLAESTIVGAGLGMSLTGNHRPVAEVQFADYLWTAINQLFNEVASTYFRSAGQWNCPMVVRMPYGGYIQGGVYHSQSIEGFLTHCPGLKVVIPSNAYDAKGLLKAAIRDQNPVVFLEHKGLYRQQAFCARALPSEDVVVPLGKAKVVKEGSDLTFVGYGMMVAMVSDIAARLEREGISVEVIDLRTLIPLDEECILQSVKKTGKVLVAHEAAKTGGFGAEIAARIAELAFEYLDAPVKRLCGKDSHVPYCKKLEEAILPQVADLEKALRDLAAY